MADFRAWRAALAQANDLTPGVQWTVKCDGRVGHNSHSREHLSRKTRQVCIGDIGFADDTTLIGEAEEVHLAEPLLEVTMRDWREKVHPGKTEGLRIPGTPRQPTDVRHKGEQAWVRHVGGILEEQGSQRRDTTQRISASVKLHQLARSWHFGTRSQQRKMPYSIWIKVMKSVLMPSLTCFGRSRVWNREHIMMLQRVVFRAVRQCFQVNRPWLHQNHVNSMQLCTLAQWEPIEFTLARQSLFWLGHVARMGCHRLPKQALFGWWTGHMTQPRPRYRQQQWFQYLLAQIQVTELDWFRLAQDRDAWRQVVLATLPVTTVHRKH